MATLPRPILAFLGNINVKIDMELLADMAEKHPNWSLALIGEVYPQAADLRRLRSLSNVHWLGNRAFETLPSLLAGVDVCLLPYARGEATRYRSPLKLSSIWLPGNPLSVRNIPR